MKVSPEELEDLWIKTLSLLEKQVSVPEYRAWVENIQPLSLLDHRLTIAVPSELSKEKIEKKYVETIRYAFQKVAGVNFPNLEIGLVVKPSSTSLGEEVSSFSSSVAGEDRLSLNPRYTFSTFIVGNSNKFAHAAAMAVAENPAHSYNPLFIYGGVGLGKTHLMHAIGHHILSNNPQARIVYASSEKFTNELINSIRDDQTEAFRQKYRHVDILLIDDIQFLAGKDRIHDEFFYTFITLHDAFKHFVITSD